MPPSQGPACLACTRTPKGIEELAHHYLYPSHEPAVLLDQVLQLLPGARFACGNAQRKIAERAVKPIPLATINISEHLSAILIRPLGWWNDFFSLTWWKYTGNSSRALSDAGNYPNKQRNRVQTYKKFSWHDCLFISQDISGVTCRQTLQKQLLHAPPLLFSTIFQRLQYQRPCFIPLPVFLTSSPPSPVFYRADTWITS